MAAGVHRSAPKNRLSALCLCIVVCLVLCPQMLLATTPGSVNEPPLSYTQRLWQMQDGLPEQVVQAFAQNVDRYLWIATTGGLVRFDGERFQTLNRENTPAFSEDNVFCLTLARGHAMWIGMQGRCLSRYRAGPSQRFSTPRGLTGGFL